MHTSMQCIILLACLSICTSASLRTCRCLRTVRSVKYDLIEEVRLIGKRPYCSKDEIIVKLKDGSSWCLDPTSRFTKALLQKWEKRGNTTSPTKATASTTTTSNTTMATVVQKS